MLLESSSYAEFYPVLFSFMVTTCWPFSAFDHMKSRLILFHVLDANGQASQLSSSLASSFYIELKQVLLSEYVCSRLPQFLCWSQVALELSCGSRLRQTQQKRQERASGKKTWQAKSTVTGCCMTAYRGLLGNLKWIKIPVELPYLLHLLIKENKGYSKTAYPHSLSSHKQWQIVHPGEKLKNFHTVSSPTPEKFGLESSCPRGNVFWFLQPQMFTYIS